ncbi:uncharacterized protein LOC133885397 [Phragmites australis]|uniref:uncharacterized protein LOC133885397 n=1 Tax=Phragmites australis TaxID=29695 RepID=UPI002D766C6D|nr:uncharacterized protein LOC133885397 [Phragmites australis]
MSSKYQEAIITYSSSSGYKIVSTTAQPRAHQPPREKKGSTARSLDRSPLGCSVLDSCSTMRKKGDGNKLGRWLGAPVRALSRACDSYVRRMSACAGRMPTHAGTYGGRGGFAPGSLQAATFSSRSRRGGPGGGDEDVNELVRAMSQRQASARGGEGVAVVVPVRSRSLAVGRIDEDAPCEFGADDDVRVGGPARRPAVRRNRSVAVGGAGVFGAAKSAVHG